MWSRNFHGAGRQTACSANPSSTSILAAGGDWSMLRPSAGEWHLWRPRHTIFWARIWKRNANKEHYFDERDDWLNEWNRNCLNKRRYIKNSCVPNARKTWNWQLPFSPCRFANPSGGCLQWCVYRFVNYVLILTFLDKNGNIDSHIKCEKMFQMPAHFAIFRQLEACFLRL